MSFSNLQIQAEALPRAETLEMRPMAPAYRRAVAIRLALGFLPLVAIPGALALVIVRPEGLKLALALAAGGSLLLALLLLPLVLRAARVQAWALREHDISHRSGLVFRRTRVVPFSRVQHAEVSVGPLQRRLGIASLKIYTAGGSTVDLDLGGLEAGEAEDVREFVMERAGQRGR